MTAPPQPLEAAGTITLKAVANLPARLFGGNAQEVTVTGLDYTLNLDIEKLPTSAASPATGKWTVVWDALEDTYKRVEFTNLPAGPTAPVITGGGIVFSARSDILASLIDPLIPAISTQGFSAPGDGGYGLYTRLPAPPVNLTNVGFVQSLDGAWWGLDTHAPLRIEQFGGKGDYFIVNQDGSEWHVNPTPFDNRAAFHAASQMLWTFGGSGGLGVGPSVQLGYGGYYMAGELVVNRSIALRGIGLGYYPSSSSTFMVFPSGSKGLVIHSAGEGINGAAQIELTNINFRNVSAATGARPANTNTPGIEAHAPIIMEHCCVDGFGGIGVQIHADVNVGSNANCFYMAHCTMQNNALSGVSCQGGDSNAGIGTALSCINNGEWGIKDDSFLGNTWVACHTASNGNIRTGTGGGYRGQGGGLNAIEFVGCYSESDQAPSYAGNGCTFRGGAHGAGIDFHGGVIEAGAGRSGPLGIRFNFDDTTNLTLKSALDTFFHVETGGLPYDFRFIPDIGLVWHYGNLTAQFSYGITAHNGSTLRDPRLTYNQFFTPQGILIGGGISSMRWHKYGTGPLTALDGQAYLRGDIVFDLNGRQGGWMCTADGANISAWVSGGGYTAGMVVRSSAGRVYECTRIPYDPDRWSTPPATVEPTHTTGTVMYPEPNPEIDPGETSTIPGYTYTPVAFNPIYLPWANFVGKAWPSGGSVTNTAGQSYSFPAPVAPPPIFNTTWAMPSSTIEPTHTSGSQEYPQPNPSPSGTEPATIPGYVWRFITSNPVAKWTGFGELFLDAPYTWTMPALLNNTSSAVQVVSVPGAAFGDFVEVTGSSPNVNGIQGVELNGWISASDQVSFQAHNRTGATITLSPTSWFVRVRKRAV